MKKIITNENVIDPGVNILGVIIFLTAYAGIYCTGIISGIAFHLMMLFFPGVACFIMSAVIANKATAKIFVLMAYIFLAIAISAMIVIAVNFSQ